jgi:1,4-alpha-glucan branching enzyme
VIGSLALILHAHLPFVRHPEHDFFLEEDWLFEAISESYVPLLRMLQRLVRENVPVRLTFSISPTLGAMLEDGLLRERYRRHLDQLITLAQKECQRNHADKSLRMLSEFYLQFFSETRRVYAEEWKCDLLAIFRELRDAGAIELVASAATHAILPILQHSSAAATHAQVAIGCEVFRETFASEPAGFWLPECAYVPGIERLLQEQNIRWFVVDAHALTNGLPAARRGHLAPCFTPAGPAAFGRDIAASKKVWNAETGYPGDAFYRDFYRDVGFDLPQEYLQPLTSDGRRFTGIKYHRVTGGDRAKELYDPIAAEERAFQHARHFVEQLSARLEGVPKDDWQPILTVPFDAELFGHWWFEGPIFLEHVIRKLGATAAEKIQLTSPSAFLTANPTQQIVQPASSSWGEKGFLDVWLDEKCAWIYPRLQAATEHMNALAKSHSKNALPKEERVLRQLVRELLLAQSSDWAFLIRNGTAREYASKRVAEHLKRFDQLARFFADGKLDDSLLAQCEERDNLFPNLDWRRFA